MLALHLGDRPCLTHHDQRVEKSPFHHHDHHDDPLVLRAPRLRSTPLFYRNRRLMPLFHRNRRYSRYEILLIIPGPWSSVHDNALFSEGNQGQFQKTQVLSCLVLYFIVCSALSCLVLSCLVVCCLVLSYLILPCLVLSGHVLSSLVFTCVFVFAFVSVFCLCISKIDSARQHSRIHASRYTIPTNTTQHNTTQHNTTQHNTTQHNTT